MRTEPPEQLTTRKLRGRWAIPLAVATFALAPASTVAAQPTRADTGQEIRAVRAVYQEVMQAIAANRLARRVESVRCEQDPFGSDITFRTDASGRVRQLTWVAGTDDHAETQRFYYDSTGRLRFIFVTRGAVNGTEEEERVYFAADGRELRRLTTQTHGPGYPFEKATPIWRPAEWVERPCSDSR